ncbi:EAL domain-containing protein [Shewanella salipaludis]|uniref:EAL domain-containing protein n=1 Tax=Shewanella salipaludis TaxID=2723052 RepID=A0A972FS12_9GAMM|nr:EAL domain-containing protein [Shewanella salipaludis]NMH64661.1 EAL domain-containing protein [Shewanella salipaludis]
MTDSIFFSLAQNTALLLALVLLYDAIPKRQQSYFPPWGLVLGLIIGGIGMTIMSSPWEYQPGVVFDSTSILLSISGLFFGGLPTLVAVLMTSAYRIGMGGDHLWLGVSILIASGFVGGLWRHYRRAILTDISFKELFFFGLTVHLVMLSCLFVLPLEQALTLLRQVALPVMLIYPGATVLIGRLISRRFDLERDEQIRLQDDFLFRNQFTSGNLGLAISSVSQRWIKVNPRLCQMLQYDEQALLRMTWTEMTYKADLAAELVEFNRMLAGEIDEYELDKRFHAKDGSLVYVHLTVACKRAHGKVQLVIAGLLDIGRQKQAESELRASQQQLALVLNSSDLGLWDWDVVSNRVERNQCSAQILGVQVDSLNANPCLWTDAIHQDDRPRILEALAAHLQGRSCQYKVEYRLRHDSGAVRWVLDTGRIVARDPRGRALRMCGIHSDITERKLAEESLSLAASVYNNSSEAMSVLDENGTIITTNAAFCEMTGYAAEEVRNKPIRILQCDLNSQLFYQQMGTAIEQTGHWQGELWQMRKNGEAYMIRLTVNTIRDKEDRPYLWVALFSDITAQKENERLIWRQANYDALTGLPNRHMLLEYLDAGIRTSQLSQQGFALLFLDLDLFKEVNDNLGHDMGDRLLVETAKRLKSCVRESDMVARLGGDEFTLVLMDIDSQGRLERLANQVLNCIAAPYILDDETAYISASVGITLYPDDATSTEELLKHADQAMYAAKNLGRNRFNYFTPSMQVYAKYRMRLIQDLRQALQNQELELHYQPIVELKSGRVTKAEALVRWCHPVRGMVSPSEFIPIAEDTGLILDIGNWVFEQAAKQSAYWRDTLGTEVQISINESQVQFRDDKHGCRDAIALLHELNLKGAELCIEVTEGLLQDADIGVRAQLKAYRDAGIQLSLDNFGTGYSSLAYLQQCHIDYLKIDKCLTNNLTASDDEMKLCEAIILMAHKLDIKVTAEGVETEAQRQRLVAIGCDYAQGYLFSRVVTATVFAQSYLQPQALDCKQQNYL